MGFSMSMPPVQPRTRMAHAAAKWAAENSGFTAYNYAVFKAFFQDGLDIGRLEILVQLAEEQGLDTIALESKAKIDSYIKQVLLDEEMARQFGVQAIPAYVANGKVLATGVQNLSQLQQLVLSE